MSHLYSRKQRGEVKSYFYAYEFFMWDKNRIITVAIMIGLFGGLVGGPIASLVYYDSTPKERFYVFIILEVIGFICAGLMIYSGKLNRKKKSNISSS